MKEYPSVTVIGAGLAGSEAAWQIASAGIKVTLFEMRPKKKSPAHHSCEFAELVCSNSFGALSSDRAAGLLQEELRKLKSIVISKADQHAVPAGGALAVDRSQFSNRHHSDSQATDRQTRQRQGRNEYMAEHSWMGQWRMSGPHASHQLLFLGSIQAP